MKDPSYLSAYEDGICSIPKRRHIQFRRRGITQKKAHNEYEDYYDNDDDDDDDNNN